MCVVTCDTDYATEDAGKPYLTWENGRCAPAPPLLYVPGLRAIFQKHREKAKWQPASTYLARRCALPSTCYADHALAGAKGAIISVAGLYITPRDLSRHKLWYQPAPLAVAPSTGSKSDTDGG
jgi:hypothetical protein